MLEVDLAKLFDKTFNIFHILKPQNRSAGWPDRMVQLSMSTIVWIELKMTTLRKDGRILLDNFDQQQAAFMFKWAKNGGYCFVLAGILNKDELVGYVIIRPVIFTDWIHVKQRLYEPSRLETFKTMDDVLLWFRGLYIKQDRYVRHKSITSA